jgi:hypothetical protein
MSDEKNQKSEEPKNQAEEVRTPLVRAGACPRAEHHKNTRVYRTVGETRYCVCDDCGHTWKRTGPRAGTPAGIPAPAKAGAKS